MDDDRLLIYRDIWSNKPVLRIIYHSYYKKIFNALSTGNTLEIGGGSGNLKEYSDNIVSIDLLSAPWIDVLANAQSLPFKDNSFDNIVLFDVLHHIEQPRLFLSESLRILKSKGRIVLLEPAITPCSWFFYHFLHQELVDMKIDPLNIESVDSERDPFDSNQAIPTLLFDKYAEKFSEIYPEFKILNKEYFSLFAYPLSGGFKKWQLITSGLAKSLLWMEEFLSPLVGKFLAFRMLIILEKS